MTSSSFDSGGNVTFLWSFAGKSCAQASVETVEVDMPGQLLDNDGRYACATSNLDGITLSNFAAGSYPFTVSAYDSSGALRYQLSGDLVTDGTDQSQSLDLVPTGNEAPGGSTPDAGTNCSDAGTDAGVQPPGGTVGGGNDGGVADSGTVDAGFDAGIPDAGPVFDAGTGGGGGSCGCGTHDGGVDAGTPVSYLSWTFPGVPNAPTCGDELSQVVLTIDGQPVSHECGAGLFPSRVALPTLSAGAHAIEIDAVDVTGRPWATTQVSIDIPAGSSTYEIYPLSWIVGSAAVDWTFFDCNGAQLSGTCSSAGVDTIAINFQDALGRWLYSDVHGYPMDDQLACDDGGRAVIRAVTPGQYTAFVAGYGPRSSGIIYSEYPDQSSYPITVQAGVFLTPSSPLSSFVSVKLYQQ